MRKINSTYFNPLSPVRMDFPDYWSSSEQLRRMYELKLRACCQFKYASEVLDQNVYFLTLTYNNDHVFHFKGKTQTHIKEDIKEFDLLAFDQTLVCNFFKKLRDYMLYYHNFTSLTYLCAEELGHTTNRPHHHLLIAMPSNISPEDVYSIFAELWTYGYIYPKQYDGGTDSHGFYHRPILVAKDHLMNTVLYCVKYMLKDCKNPNNIYDEAIARFESCKDFDHLRKLKRAMPKIKTSLRFGSAIEYYLEKDCKDVDELYDRCVNGLNLDWYNPDELVSLPTYTKNRIFFKNTLDRIEVYEDENGKERKRYRYCRYRTDLYKDVQLERFDTIVDNIAQELRDDALSCLLDNSFKEYCKSHNIFYDDHIFNGVNYDHLAVYQNVYRNRVSPSHLFDFLTNSDKYRTKTISTYVHRDNVIKCHSYDRVFNRRVVETVSTDYDLLPTFQVVDRLDYNPFILDKNINFLPCGEEDIEYMCKYAYDYLQQINDISDYSVSLYKNNFEFSNLVLFNSFPCFTGFDTILSVISEFRRYRRSTKDGKLNDILNDQNYLCKKDVENLIENLDYSKV